MNISLTLHSTKQHRGAHRMKDVEHVLTGWKLIVGANAVDTSAVEGVQRSASTEVMASQLAQARGRVP